jgi:hypothetical protein
MTECVKCKYDPEAHLCPYCGAESQTLALFDGKMLTICCHRAPKAKTLKGGK